VINKVKFKFKFNVKKSKKKVIIAIGLILIIIAIAGFKHHNKVNAANQTKVVESSGLILNQSDVVTVKHGDVESALAFTGDLTSLTKVIISSEAPEEVKQVFVKEGQFVKKGQLLAILDDTDLVQNVSESRAKLEFAKSQFELDKVRLERNQDLYQQGFISKINYAELKNAYQGSLQLIKQQQATLQKLQRILANTKVVAPFSGNIYKKSIDIGQFATLGTPLFSIANLDMMQIIAAIPSDQINMITLNQPVNFKIESDDTVYQGKITRINPVAEAGTRSYSIYIDFNNTIYKLRAGQFVKGQIVTRRITNVDYVASTAVRKNITNGVAGAGSDSAVTYVLAIENGVIVSKPVKILLTNTVAEISAVSGLKVGDVILGGNILTAKVLDKVKIMD
jgi:RND family efflux transporter MFP subunit